MSRLTSKLPHSAMPSTDETGMPSANLGPEASGGRAAAVNFVSQSANEDSLEAWLPVPYWRKRDQY
eukprot:955090-Prymnesium_polylepis.1